MAELRIESVLVAELVEDISLYPRCSIDSVHVNDMVRALQAGDELPPIIVDKASLRIVDGFHRRRAWMSHAKNQGIDLAEVRVPVIFKTYRSEQAIFADAVRYNSSHGRKLARQDEIRITVLAKDLGIETRLLAKVMHVTVERVEELRCRVVISEATGERIPAKPVIDFMYGQNKKIDEEQEKVLDHFGGYRLLQTVSQLTSVVETGLFDSKDQKVLDGLHELASCIRQKVPKEVTA